MTVLWMYCESHCFLLTVITVCNDTRRGQEWMCLWMPHGTEWWFIVSETSHEREAGWSLRRYFKSEINMLDFYCEGAFYSADQKCDIRHQGRDVWPKDRDVWPQGRDVWPQSRDVWPQSRDVWPQSRDVWPRGRDVWPRGRDVWPQCCGVWP